MFLRDRGELEGEGPKERSISYKSLYKRWGNTLVHDSYAKKGKGTHSKFTFFLFDLHFTKRLKVEVVIFW